MHTVLNQDVNKGAEEQPENDQRRYPVALFLSAGESCFAYDRLHDVLMFLNMHFPRISAFCFQRAQHKPNAVPQKSACVFTTQVSTFQFLK